MFHQPGDEDYKKHRFLRLSENGFVDLIGMASKHPSWRVNPGAIKE